MTDFRPDAGPSLSDTHQSTIDRLQRELAESATRITALTARIGELEREIEGSRLLIVYRDQNLAEWVDRSKRAELSLSQARKALEVWRSGCAMNGNCYLAETLARTATETPTAAEGEQG